jgi:hypothetical protein
MTKASLITNSLIDKTLVPRMNAVLKENLVNVILSKRIPNYLTEEGPYIETIYDIRSRDLIKEFRNKIDQVIGNRDNESINDLISKIENEFNEIRNEFTLRAFNKLRIYNSIGSVAKAVVPEVLKNVPGLGIGISAYDITKDLEVWNDREYAWAGFLADLEMHAVSTGKGS